MPPTDNSGGQAAGTPFEPKADPVPEFLAPRFHEDAFPWRQIIGYVLSLALTLLALALVIQHVLSPALLLIVVLVMAGVQAAVQFGFFMHLRESTGPAWHIASLALGIAVALGIVAFSIWIMSFKWGAF